MAVGLSRHQRFRQAASSMAAKPGYTMAKANLKWHQPRSEANMPTSSTETKHHRVSGDATSRKPEDLNSIYSKDRQFLSTQASRADEETNSPKHNPIGG
ncbi:hypothetical protein PoB_006469300 [Plakobranchus ocellatus]|uniref:Uncharacterized protein n=1 Tax=Plakobranchus ocellatus TaxID=259542 RepID=A0AAV4D1Z2_9GAST|nr:hypothetical protein PoB_006469300 [Plakobranchus ocellatus]